MRDRYAHPLWTKLQALAADHKQGHGGMDFLENARLIAALRAGEPTEMNVYDAATWSCIVGLTGESVANRSRPVDVPDFTRGRWQHWAPVPIVGA